MMFHHGRSIALVAVLVGIALVSSTRLYGQQTLDALRLLAEQGRATHLLQATKLTARQECPREERWDGSNCVAVDIPANADLNILGNDWQCQRGFKPVGDHCQPMTEQERIEQA